MDSSVASTCSMREQMHLLHAPDNLATLAQNYATLPPGTWSNKMYVCPPSANPRATRRRLNQLLCVHDSTESERNEVLLHRVACYASLK